MPLVTTGSVWLFDLKMMHAALFSFSPSALAFSHGKRSAGEAQHKQDSTSIFRYGRHSIMVLMKVHEVKMARWREKHWAQHRHDTSEVVLNTHKHVNGAMQTNHFWFKRRNWRGSTERHSAFIINNLASNFLLATQQGRPELRRFSHKPFISKFSESCARWKSPP